MLPALRNTSLAPRTTPVNRLFDSFFDDDFFNFGSPPLPSVPRMGLSVWQDDDHVYVEADAPGVAEGDLDVSYLNGILTICGERKWEKKENGYDSRSYGRFEQRVMLPTEIDAERIEAALSQGVLRLTMPKAETAKPRKIAIRAQ